MSDLDMRRLAAAIALATLSAGCAGTSDGAADSAPATATESAASTPDTAAEPAQNDPATSTPPALAGDTAYAQLENLRATGSELDVALIEFAAILGPLPGVPELIDDDTIYPSLTHVLDTIEAHSDDLTADQAEAVERAVAATFDPAKQTAGFALFDDVGDDAEVTGSEPEGFAPRGFASPTEEAPDEYQRLIRQVGNELLAYLGGAPLNIWVELFEPGTFGDVAGRNRGLDLTDPRRAEYPTGPDCLMQITSGAVPADIVGIVTHEVTHCWQFTRLGFDVARMNAMDKWAKEGMAAYVGEAVGGLTRYNAEWWGGFLTTRIDGDGQWNTFTRTYDAIGLWSRLAAGGDVVAAMRRTIDAAPSNSAMYAAATSGIDLSTLGSGTFQRADWGGAWTASGPGMPGTPRTTTTHRVIERNDIALSADAGAQANHEITVSPIDGADGTVLTVQGTGHGLVRLDPDDIPLAGAYVEEWCLGSCECPDGGGPAFPAERTRTGGVELAASLVGGPSEGTTMRVRVDRFDPDDTDRCNEEEEEEEGAGATPPSDIADTGLVGTWIANADSVAAMFQQASGFGAESGFEVIGANGPVIMTFAPDGSGSLVYDSVTLFLADQIIGDLTIGGTGTFGWSTSGGALVITGTEFAYAVGSSALGEEFLTITDDDVPSSGSTTLSGAVDGNVLTITSADGSAGRVFFPTTWIRQ